MPESLRNLPPAPDMTHINWHYAIAKFMIEFLI